jgi:hypothetical protein
MRQFTQQRCTAIVVVVCMALSVSECTMARTYTSASTTSSSSSSTIDVDNPAISSTLNNDGSASSSFLRRTDVDVPVDLHNNENNNNNNFTTYDPFLQLELMREFRAQLQRERERKDRLKDRRTKAREVYNKLPKSPQGKIELVTPEEWDVIDTKQKQRGLSWFGDSGSGNAYSNSILADPGAYYDKWAQAYRMLGGFIDCDHAISENSHDNGNNNGNNNGGACSRWMMWAAVCTIKNL